MLKRADPSPAAQVVESPPAVVPHRPSLLVLRLVRGLIATAMLAGLFLTCLKLYSMNNDFPAHYHPDEPGKVAQVAGWSNFNHNHPLLLLRATQLAVWWFDVPDDPHRIVVTGRWVSAVFGATAAVALALAGFVLMGFPGLLAVGATVGLCTWLLLYSHYMKEDAALAVGVALSILGIVLVWRAKGTFGSLLACAFLGAGIAVAVSGKYVGLVTLVLALPAIVWPPRRWMLAPVRAMTLLAALLMTLLAINAPAFEEKRSLTLTEQAARGIDREFSHSVSHHHGVTMNRPNTFFLNVVWTEAQWHVVVLGGLYLLLLLMAWRQRWGVEYVVVGFFIIFLVILSHSVINFHRYALPVTLGAYWLAGLGLAATVNGLPRWWMRAPALAVGLALVVAMQWPICWSFIDQFANDSRQQARVWMAQNLPRNARVLADDYVGLGTPGDPLRFPDQPELQLIVYSRWFAPDLMGRVRLSRVRYIAVCELAYERFFAPQVFGAPGMEEIFDRRKSGYQRIFEQGELLWESDQPHPTYAFTNPKIKIYRVGPEFWEQFR